MVKKTEPLVGTSPFLRTEPGRIHLRPGIRSRHVPFGLKQFPGDVEGNERLARARGQREQDALLAPGDTVEHAVDGNLLIVAQRLLAVLIERLCAEYVTPVVGLTELPLPELVGRWKLVYLPFAALLRVAVNLIDVVAVGSVGEADIERRGIVLGLRHALLVAHLVALGLHDGELHVAVDEHVVGLLGLTLHGLAHLSLGE